MGGFAWMSHLGQPICCSDAAVNIILEGHPGQLKLLCKQGTTVNHVIRWIVKGIYKADTFQEEQLEKECLLWRLECPRLPGC